MIKKPIYTISLLWVFTISIAPSPAKDTVEIYPRTDIPLTLATGGVGATIALIRAERFVPVVFDGDRKLIIPIDRPFAGIYRPGLSTVSDITLAATILASPLFLALTHDQPNHFLDNGLLVLEAFSISNLLLQITKTAVSRPRPLMYAKDLPPKQRRKADNFLSFFSGHTFASFSFATMTSLLVYESDMSDALKATTAGITLSLASTTAVLRIAAGKHFPTDVFSGALIAAATSMVILELHKKGDTSHSSQTANSATVFSLTLPL